MSISLDRLGGLILGLELMHKSVNCQSCDDTLEALKYLFVVMCDQRAEEERRLRRYRQGGRKRATTPKVPFVPPAAGGFKPRQLVAANQM